MEAGFGFRGEIIANPVSRRGACGVSLLILLLTRMIMGVYSEKNNYR